MEEMANLYGGGFVKNLSTYDFDISSSGKVSLKPHVYKDLTNKVGFIQFYAPWCGHCRNFVDSYVYLSELANRKLFLVGAYNSTQKDNEKVLQALNVEGFPTIKFFSIGGNGQVTLTDYTESRDPDAMLDYLCKNKDVCVAKKGGKKSPKKISGGCGCGLTGGAKKRRSPKKRTTKKRTMKKSSPKRRGGAKKSPKRSPRRR
jgi:thiol-disulfide isomerase/thioredoxin